MQPRKLVARQSSASTVPLVMALFVREPATHGNRPLAVVTAPSRDRAAVGRFGLATLARVLRTSTLDRMELDHVLIGVTDLSAAAREFEARCGLVSVEGGSHPHWGTANRIVPLGTSYVELVAVVDEATAADSSFGQWVASGASKRGRPLGWAVRTGKLDQTARRLGLAVSGGSRIARTGDVLRWRLAGIEQAAAEPSLPFFIEWGTGTRLPGSMPISHPAAPVEVSKLLLDGDPWRLAAWLGDHTLPIVVRAGSPALTAIVLSAATGEIVLGAGGRGGLERRRETFI
jgi:hypothetical protein